MSDQRFTVGSPKTDSDYQAIGNRYGGEYLLSIVLADMLHAANAVLSTARFKPDNLVIVIAPPVETKSVVMAHTSSQSEAFDLLHQALDDTRKTTHVRL